MYWAGVSSTRLADTLMLYIVLMSRDVFFLVSGGDYSLVIQLVFMERLVGIVLSIYL